MRGRPPRQKWYIHRPVYAERALINGKVRTLEGLHTANLLSGSWERNATTGVGILLYLMVT